MKEKFESFLKANQIQAKSYHPYYEEALNYMLLSGGKHFRAQLLLGVVEALNPSKIDSALRVALGVEMIHTYSLIHDDLPVMDDSNLRRGKITTHKKYDEVTALLVGDALNSRAFYEISRANLEPKIAIKCVEILSFAATQMVLGQALDCYFEKKTLSYEELKILHSHKTGALISASFELGAVISGVKDSLRFKEVGLKLGLLFQIVDDIIDVTMTKDEAGKPTHHDEDKNSFVNLLGLKGAQDEQDKLISEIKIDDKKVQNLLDNLIEKYLKG